MDNPNWSSFWIICVSFDAEVKMEVSLSGLMNDERERVIRKLSDLFPDKFSAAVSEESYEVPIKELVSNTQSSSYIPGLGTVHIEYSVEELDKFTERMVNALVDANHFLKSRLLYKDGHPDRFIYSEMKRRYFLDIESMDAHNLLQKLNESGLAFTASRGKLTIWEY